MGLLNFGHPSPDLPAIRAVLLCRRTVIAGIVSMRSVLMVIAALPFILGIHFGNASTLLGQVAMGYSIPDPDKKMSIAYFLANKSVADELGLDDEQRDTIKALLRENGGSLSAIRLKGGAGPKRGLDELKLQFATKRASYEVILDETIDPIQLDRLTQIVYQIERSRIGLGESLSNGFLGKDIGVDANQKTELRTVAEAVEKRSEKAIWDLKYAAIDEVIRELTGSQQEEAKQTLGDPFRFREDMSAARKEHRTKIDSGKIASIPDPASLVAVAGLALNGSIAKELRLTSEQRISIEGMHKNAKGPLPLAEFQVRGSRERELIKNELQKQVDGVFTIEQKSRLPQLAYRVEIERVGVIGSLVDGYLGKILGVDNSQKPLLEKKVEALKSKVSNEIRRIRTAARNEVFSHLPSIQREKANKILGNEFVFLEN